MAVNKSKSWFWLWVHATVYSLCFIPWGFKFYLITFLTHFVTDAITSRITSKLWFIKLEGPVADEGEPRELWYAYPRLQGNRHYFFVMIGLDQFIHYCTLAWTLALLR